METNAENRISPSMIDDKKRSKLIKSFPKYLKSKRKSLIKYYGLETTDKILVRATLEYPEIISKIKDFHTPMYDALM